VDLTGFAEEVGADGPVVPVGGRTQWDVGGPPAAGAREVRAPGGVVEYEPAEMVVRCGAGTTVAELDAVLAASGQMVPLDAAEPGRATVGGVLAVGRSGLRRLRYGPVRDVLLEARYVSAEGRLVKAGGPVVKNVSGFDLCRLLVGSLGTLGVLGEVVVRARPRPRVARWFRVAGADPFDLRRRLFAPSALLWDGSSVWALLEGHGADVASEAALLGAAAGEVEGPPALPAGGRLSLRPGELHRLPSLLGEGEAFVAEVGVGTVHLARPRPDLAAPAGPGAARLCAEVKARFDPTGRLNPGRQVIAA
jgi:FAD/FMN-containing dehydrogenase